MKITGHKTRSTFDRYNIASRGGRRRRVERTTVYVAKLPTQRKVTTIEQPQHGRPT